MSHRDLSITGHITNETHGDNPVTDEQKHAWCKRRLGPNYCAVFLPPLLYAAAEAAGYDMRWKCVACAEDD